MNFQTLCNMVGYWMAVRMTLTYIGVDFTSAVDDDSSLAIKAGNSRFVLWYMHQGNMECDMGIRYTHDADCSDVRIAKGIDATFELLGDIRKMVEGDIQFNDIYDDYV